MPKSIQRVLAIFAHPDDETFLAGGTLAKCAAAGHDVFLVCASHGEAGRRGEYDELSQEEFAELREAELHAACSALGVHTPLLLDCADHGLANECLDSARDEIAAILRRISPQVVITFGPDGVSGHLDHVALSGIATKAFREVYPIEPSHRAKMPVDQPRLYYVLRPANLPSGCTNSSQVEPPPTTTLIDIGSFGSKKLAAARCYRSQKHLLPENTSAVDALSRGSEPFHRAIPPWEGAAVETDLFNSRGAA